MRIMYVMIAMLGIGGVLALWPLQSQGAAVTTASCIAIPSPVLNTYAYQVSFFAESNSGIYKATTELVSATGASLSGGTHTYEGPPYPKAVGVSESLFTLGVAATFNVNIYDKNLNERATFSATCV